jgi:diguanylate cyclase (GGDEF)-like protein
LPASRPRPLVSPLLLPGALTALAGGAALGAAAVISAPWPARIVAALAAAAAGPGTARWLGDRAARRQWLARHAEAQYQEAPAARRARATPSSAPRDVLVELLRDVRDALGADDAVFWRVAAGGNALVAAATAGDGSPFDASYDAATLEVIAWSAHERVAQYRVEPGGALAAAPVLSRGAVVGALSVHAAAALRGTADELRARLLRHALHVGDVADLIETRVEHERQSRHSQQLLAAANEFQVSRSPAELAAALCTAALAVGGVQRAALVRWSHDEGAGRVEYLTAGHDAAAPRAVAAESLVGGVCREGLPQLWEDARRLDSGTLLFGPGERPRTIGSLGVVPITGHGRVLGALVLESDEAGALTAQALRAVRLLVGLASVSIETLDDFEAAERRAHTDQLTGLPNRRAFDAQFGAALDRADRYGEPVAVIMCDVDRFKGVNDTHGHQVGDRVLQTVGAALKLGVRAVDSCARLGGEEFVVLLPRTGRAGALELAERLRRAVEARAIRVDGRELRVTASFGVAVFPTSVTARDDLLPAADRALYQAKRDGRNCVRCADATAVID